MQAQDNRLGGTKVAFITANDGVEEVELTEPWKAVEAAGGQPVLIAPKPGKVQARRHLEKSGTYDVDLPVGEASVTEFVGLVLPGGVANPDRLRMNSDAMKLVRSFFDADLPVAAICHAAWSLVEAGVVDGRTVTSWPSVQTDLRNAGATWVDKEVVVDGKLVTSRKPDDLPAFCQAMLDVFGREAEGRGVS